MRHSIQTIDEQFRSLCGRHNWRCTAQRRAVFACLHQNRRHPTAEAVWQQVRNTLPDVSLDSVYRILKEFADIGHVRRLDSGDVMRFDPDTSPHDHFLCTVCGTVFDFSCLDSGGVAEACRQFGTVASVELQVRGVCHECVSRGHGN